MTGIAKKCIKLFSLFRFSFPSSCLGTGNVKKIYIKPFYLLLFIFYLSLFVLISCESTGSAIISSKTTTPSKPLSSGTTPSTQNKQNVLPTSPSPSVSTSSATPTTTATPTPTSSQSPAISSTPSPTPTPTSSQSLPPIPNSPSGLSKTNISTGGFTVNWNPITGATGYNVYKGGTKIASDIIPTYYNVSGLNPNTTCNITITATNSGGESNHSSTLNVTTLSTAPTELSKSAVTLTGFILTWNAVTGATSYKIYKDGALYADNVTETSKEITELIANTTYNMTVKAVNVSGESTQSSSLIVTTALDAPTGLLETDVTQTSFTLNWSAVTSATSYKVYKDGTNINTVIAPTTTYPVTGLNPNTQYNMAVTAVNANGESVRSELKVTTANP